MVTAKGDGYITRNSSRCKKVHFTYSGQSNDSFEPHVYENINFETAVKEENNTETVKSADPAIRRSNRSTQKPVWLEDYAM